jgi:hypothetical protein
MDGDIWIICGLRIGTEGRQNILEGAKRKKDLLPNI